MDDAAEPLDYRPSPSMSCDSPVLSKWRYPVLVLVCSLLLVVTGFVYDFVMVGLPTLDPTPAVAAANARDQAIPMWMTLLGIAAFVASLVWLGILGVRWFLRGAATSPLIPPRV